MAQRRSISDIGVRFVSDEIKRDHRDLEILYKVIVQAVDEGDDTAATGFKEQFCCELAGHLVAMQLLIFPGTNSRADAGNLVALRRRGNLAMIRDDLLHLVRLETSDDGFRAALEPLAVTLRQHIKAVENTDLVAIEKALDGEESERMARDWQRARYFLPGGGRDPPFDTIEELLGASYEDLRAAWERLPRE